MRYRESSTFIRDFRRLRPSEQGLFLRVVQRDFHPACERFAQDPGAAWPRGLRVKRVQGAPGVWEMTWSFAGPDGRATFEWTQEQGELVVRWRRIGGHEVFERP